MIRKPVSGHDRSITDHNEQREPQEPHALPHFGGGGSGIREYVCGAMSVASQTSRPSRIGRALRGLGERGLRAIHAARTALRGTRYRVVVGAVCGLGFALFPGFAVLALQACLALAWACFMVSLFLSGLRGAGGFR